MKEKVVGALVIGLALTVAAGIWFKEQSHHQLQQKKRSRGAPAVVVSPAQMAPVRWTVEALGTVKARESVELKAKITERVQAIHFTDGDSVELGQLLLTLRDGEQQAKLQAARANLAEQQREYHRIEGLVKRKTVARTELDRLLTGIDVAKAQLAQYQAELDARQIRAPFTGVLGLRQVSPGALLKTETVITTLDDLAKVKLDFTVPERFVSELSPGKTVEGQVAAYPGERFVGTVISVDSRVNPRTRAVVVRAELDNAELKLRPGMLMTLTLITEERVGLVIPEESLVPRQKAQYVMVVNADSQVEERRVEIGMRTRGQVEILSGLSEGEQIIRRGIQKVRPGQKVTTQAAERFTHKETG